MGGPKHPYPIDVRGGTGSLAVDCADMTAMARHFGEAAADSLSSALALHGYLVHPSVLTSSVFDPAGFGAFEADLLSALDGFGGLTWTGTEAGVLDGELRAAATAYLAADTIYTDLHDAISGAVRAPLALGRGLDVLTTTGNPIAAAQAAIAADPSGADTVVNVLGVPTLLLAGAHGMADGRGVVCRPGMDAVGVAGLVPRTLTDVLGDLAQRNDDAHHGEIDVRILTMADGSRRAIVDITGTKSWDPLPTRDITSLTTNGRALVGQRTAYEQGVLAAMRAAGVRKGDDVMLVGHSQGGLVAINTARDATASGEFNVTHVLTAGSPIGLTAGSVPAKVKVLALENRTDVVPHLDGRQNPDTRNVTTVTGTAGDGTVIGDHDIDGSYVPIARAAQASHNTSVRDYVHSARGYLTATKVETHTYQIQRR